MRVLYIDVNCKQSSTGKIVYDLYYQCNQNGHDAAICYGRGPIVDEKNIYKFALDWETTLHAALTRLTGWTGCFSPLSTRRLLKFMDSFQPDVVHLHEPHAYFVNLKPLFSYLKRKNIPLVYTFHCEFAYTGKCGYAYECDRWKTGCGHCPKLKDYPKTLWFDFTAQMFRQKKELLSGIQNMIITAPSGWLANRAKQSYLSDRDIRVVHNGIDTETVFHPQEVAHLREKHGLGDEKIVVAVAPDLMSARKGGRWVLQLADAMKDDSVKFIMVGIDDLSEKFPDNVIPLGRTANQQELAQYYSLADCFVICSEKENFPTTCLEAFCCGTPIAGFSAGGTAETVPAPYGKFCEYGNIPELTAQVREQLEIKYSRQEIADQANLLYSRKTMYQHYQKLYKEVWTEAHT